MPTKKTAETNIEKSLQTLNQLVETLEKGNLPLEKSLEEFEKGVGIIRDCQKALNKAEKKVQILTQKGNEALEDFNLDKTDD